jgi:putative thioredoxin
MDVTDATFERDVLERSVTVPVVVDLWAEWCGPCKTLGPILERVIAATDGRVELVKVDVDANPSVSSMFRVQSIPAVYAVKDRAVVDGFIGALPEKAVAEFVARLAPVETEADRLASQENEAGYRAALDIQADHPQAVVGLAELLIERGETDEALALLARVPENAETRRLAALARVGTEPAGDDVEWRLEQLLDRVKDDDDARQEYIDLLEVLGPNDPRTARYRKALTARLF